MLVRMATSGLLFIPDIGGFTRFVTETGIDHSRRIIQEPLEVVIDADALGPQVGAPKDGWPFRVSSRREIELK